VKNQVTPRFAMIESSICSCILNKLNHANRFLSSSHRVLKEIEQPMCNNRKSTSGFTLLELIVAISIAGILMAMAIPSFKDMIRNSRLTTYANEMVTSLNLARSEAVKRGVSVSVRKSSSITGCTPTYWSTCGWNVFVDDGAGTAANKDNGVLDTGEQILRTYPALPTSFTLAGNNNFVNFIRYQADGTSTTLGSFAICDNSDGNNLPEPYTSKLIIISQVGRIRMARDSNNDGVPEKDNSGTPLSSCTSP
jgi:type IV fimbrial biogenesis protein FimT